MMTNGGSAVGKNIPQQEPGSSSSKGFEGVISQGTKSIMDKVGITLTKDGILNIPSTENVSGMESLIDFKSKGVKKIYIGSYITPFSQDAGYVSFYTEENLGKCEEYTYLYTGSTIVGFSHDTIITQLELKDRLVGHDLYILPNSSKERLGKVPQQLSDIFT